MTSGAIGEETPILSATPKRHERTTMIGDTRQRQLEDTARPPPTTTTDEEPSKDDSPSSSGGISTILGTFLSSIPAVILITALNTMLAVPFGSAYLSSVIPLDEVTRETLGIRLSLMALFVGQFVMGGGFGPFLNCGSSFDPVIVWQLGELSPFYHTLAKIVAAIAHNNDEILPTTLYLMSLTSLCVGAIAFLLGKFGFGQLTYFFPTHVLLGLVGGIGVWLAVLSTSVSISPSRAPPGPALWSAWTVQFLIGFLFAMSLRVLRHFFPKEKFMLLDPLFFLSIPLVFYLGLFLVGVSVQDAVEAGFFFADPDQAAAEEDGSHENSISPWVEASQLWTDFDVAKVRWDAAFYAAPTLLAAGVMGVMITSPFIPATATLFPSIDFDFNREFISHGWSNVLSAIACPGGLGMSVCYSTTSVYKTAGGKGRLASAFVSFLTLAAVVYGPGLVQHIPRCMASSIVLDMGVALFLEAVVDPAKTCDKYEYVSIWVVIFVLNVFDMTAALIAGLLAAVFTYSLQTSVDRDPVRLMCDSAGFPSSKWRNITSQNILNDKTKGRSRIVVIQLQSYIFFGNVARIQDQIFAFLNEKTEMDNGVFRVLLDFSIVHGIDTTASTYFEKMIERIEKKYGAVTYMVSGPLELKDGALQEKATIVKSRRKSSVVFSQTPPSHAFSRSRETSRNRRVSCSVRGPYETLSQEAEVHGVFFESLDEALIKSEDDLISVYDWKALVGLPSIQVKEADEERGEIIELLLNKFMEATEKSVGDLVASCRREVWKRGDVLWMEGDGASSAMILLGGCVEAVTDEKDGKTHSRSIEIGDIIGLRCMVLNEHHRAQLICKTETVLYVLSQEAYLRLVEENLRVVHMIHMYLARDLSRRLQHASNELYLNRNTLT